MKSSKVTTHQKKQFSKLVLIDNKEMLFKVTVRYDDECGNGHNSFSITGNIGSMWGCIHKEISLHFPELAHLIKWHNMQSNGPMYYIENTIYHASSKDCNGLEKGEKRQIKNGRTGLPAWELMGLIGGEWVPAKVDGVKQYIDSKIQPVCEVVGMSYQPWCRVGEGKEPNLAAARSCAIWEDASLEQLQDKEALLLRLPNLINEFKSVIESSLLSFTF